MLLYLGIIDILQSYKFKKKLEHGLKAIITDGVCSVYHVFAYVLDHDVNDVMVLLLLCQFGSIYTI